MSASMLQSSTAECSSSSRRAERRIAGLGFARLEVIQLHEDYRPSHEEPLARRIRSDGYLANPLLVSSTGDRTFALDGHHRRECLRQCGCPYALVQRVPLRDHRQLAFREWCHVAQVESPTEWVDEMASYRLGLAELSPTQAESMVARRRAVCWIARWEQPHRVLTVAPGDRSMVDALRVVTSLYRPRRLTLGDLPSGCLGRPELVFAAQPAMNVFVRFARIDRHQVAELVETEQRIPAGITRTLVLGGRAIGLNVPLELLGDRSSEGDRAAWLEALRYRSATYYRGPTIVDEAGSPRRYDDPLWVYDPTIRPRPV